MQLCLNIRLFHLSHQQLKDKEEKEEMKKEVAKWNEELDALKTQFEKEKEQWREEEKGMANEQKAKMVEVVCYLSIITSAASGSHHGRTAAAPSASLNPLFVAVESFSIFVFVSSSRYLSFFGF